MKKKGLLFSVLVVLVISIGTSAIVYISGRAKSDAPMNKVVHLSANALTFHEVDKLDAFAELIVIGYASEDFRDREHVITAFDDGTMQSFHTNTPVRIEKILKKPEDFPADQRGLTIIEPVSLDGDVKYTADGYVEIQKGDTSVLFLMRNTYGDYGLINGNLGKFSLEGIRQSSVPEAATAQQLSEYAAFRDSVMKKYNLGEDS
ncbi:hypothetical protein KQI74_16440 [Paenibacillus barcinonensis]|uniref:hypothetical protein n=1 Tax=Paenibacillus barcinonensis TaxID=198119 RepID=UPI001C108DCD|nr:hypothetical protein [Paenibacillus barcinonensis]MBU5353874.1 hypothetical protein [Paenibacillus barcinonensis]MDM5279146.1 hypothetical protein [Paenibacillus silvae]